MGTQLVPLLARLLSTLAALPLDEHELNNQNSSDSGTGGERHDSSTHILRKALTFAFDTTSSKGNSMETMEDGARVAAASLLRCVCVCLFF